MSNENKEYSKSGWGILALLVMFGFFATLLGQFFGVAWFFPWIFLGMFVFLALRHQKIQEEAKREDNAPYTTSNDYVFPHLTSIPGQYTRRPCENPEWIQIPLYRNYEINCETLVVRDRLFGNIIDPGHDPNGEDDRGWFHLVNDHGFLVYVPRDWVVSKALGKGHVEKGN